MIYKVEYWYCDFEDKSEVYILTFDEERVVVAGTHHRALRWCI